MCVYRNSATLRKSLIHTRLQPTSIPSPKPLTADLDRADVQLFLSFIKRSLGVISCLCLSYYFPLWDFINIGKQRFQKALRFIELVSGVAAVQQLVLADLILADKCKARFGIQLKADHKNLYEEIEEGCNRVCIRLFGMVAEFL